MTPLRRLIPIIVGLVALSFQLSAVGCASLPAKQRALVSLQATHAVLGQAQDLERGFYANKTIPTLTPPMHELFSRAFAAAFDAEIKATVVLKAWRAWDQPPPDLATLMAAVREGLAVTHQLAGGAGTQSLLAKFDEAAGKVQSVLDTIGGAQ